MPTPLAALLRQQIAATGPLDVADYMAQCLYHPQFGYYTNGHNFLPAPTTGTPYPHDFTTAPELTPLFGATLANWVAKNAPSTAFTLMECGPGRGTLMLDMLTHLQKAHPQTFTNALPLLVETSPALASLQQQTLLRFPRCQWAIAPASDLPVVLVANELLDAFPHTQNIIQNSTTTKQTITTSKTGNFHFSNLNGITDEISPSMQTWLAQLPQTLHAAVFLDYGTTTTSPTGDTLQAVYRHRKVGIFHRPGETDLTTHVNFHHVIQALATSHPHLVAEPLEPLATFLLGHGLASLALSQTHAEGPHPEQDTILHRLLHPSQMGTLFQVQCLKRDDVHAHPHD